MRQLLPQSATLGPFSQIRGRLRSEGQGYLPKRQLGEHVELSRGRYIGPRDIRDCKESGVPVMSRVFYGVLLYA